MRPFSAIVAAFLVSGVAAPAPARADAAPGCHCPGVPHHHVRRLRHHYVRHWGYPPPPAMPPPAPVEYNPLLPGPYDSAYDRAMVLHFRSPPVTGIYIADPGYPPTPPVHGVIPYRTGGGASVMQYDGAIGDYVQLARYDAERAMPPPPPAAPAAKP